MKLKTSILVLVLMSCAAFVGADEQGAEDKTYVSTDLLGIVMGNYQLGLEQPIAQNLSLIVEAQYYNWQYGLMPKLLGLYMNLIGSMAGVDDMNDFTDIFYALEMYGVGGTIGLAKYNGRTVSTYYAGTLSYSYYHVELDMDSILVSNDPYATPMESINMPIHIGSIAGRIGTKLHLGSVGIDLFYMLTLNGVYVDMVGLYQGLGLDIEAISMLDRLYIKLGSMSFMPGSGLGLRLSVAF